jgi:hypothetical protein
MKLPDPESRARDAKIGDKCLRVATRVRKGSPSTSFITMAASSPCVVANRRTS